MAQRGGRGLRILRGDAFFAGLMLAGWWLARHQAKSQAMGAALWAPVGVLVALGINQLGVATVNEPRPYAVLDHPLLLTAATTDPAFPSDHAVMAGAVAAGLWLVSRRPCLLATAAAVTMAGYRSLRPLLAGSVIRLLRALRPLLTSVPARPESAVR